MKIPQHAKWKSAASLVSAALLAFACAASAQLTLTENSQLGTMPFTPTWTPATDSLIANLAPTTATGNFAEYGTGGSAANLTTAGASIQVRAYAGAGNLEMCGNDGTAGSLLLYTLPSATFGYNITNITVYGGWQDAGRDAQDYCVYYSTVDDPSNFKYLTGVHFNPSIPNGIGSATRVAIQDASGAPIAGNVAALKFDFTSPGTENGAVGYTAITVQGTAAAGPTNAILAVTYSTQNPVAGTPPSWTIETDSLIAGQLPSAVGGGDFAAFGIGSPGVSALTDGVYGNVDDGAAYATCGSGAGCGSSVTYTLNNSENGSDLTNIVVYSGWANNGRDGQFYQISYSTISAPTKFIPLTSIVYNPTGGSPISDRVAISTSTGAPLAKNVKNVKFDFSKQDGYLDNGASLYSEIIVEGTSSASTTAPNLVQDTLPSYAETVVGDQVVFTAAYNNSPAANLQWQFISTNNVVSDIPGATTATLALDNLQLTNSGSYRLKAVNAADASGVEYSSAAPLVVGSVPAPVNNVILKYAGQCGLGDVLTNFAPPWTVDTGSDLIYGATYSGALPNAVPGNGVFDQQGTDPDPILLTDGAIGSEDYPSGNSTMVVCGNSPNGDTMTYILDTTSAPLGFDLTNITVFGGWGNDVHNQQYYQILYSTVASPDSFLSLGTFEYTPNDPAAVQSATRTTLIPASGYLARGVAKIQFHWVIQNPAPKNVFGGYSEIVVGGKPSPAVPRLVQDINPVTAKDVVGSQLTMTAAFADATGYQWQKNGTNLTGATSPTLTITNLQLSDAGSYLLVASNPSGDLQSSVCSVTVDPAPTATNNIITAFAIQTETTYVGPTWDTSTLGSSLIAGQNPPSGGYDTVGNFNDPDTGVRNLNTAGGLPVLTDGNYGVFGSDSDPAFATCGPIGPGNGAGRWVSYLLPANANGYDITNIVVAGGWNDAGRQSQQYTILYSTVANPTIFVPLESVAYNPALPAKTMTRATFTPASGTLASNVYAVYIDFTQPPGVANGYCGYSEIAIFGAPSALAPAPGIQFETENQNTATASWTIETPSLIAGQMPSDAGGGNFSAETGIAGPSALTDGQYLDVTNYGSYASCGGSAGQAVTYTSANGWDLTNIVVYSGWTNYNRDGQFYDVYYSTLSAPRTWIKLTSVYYNPLAPAGVDGSLSPSANRVSIAMSNGGLLAANVAAVKFDFSVQSGADNGYSGYSEIVLQGSELPATQPVITRQHEENGNSWSVEPGNLIAGKLPASFTGGAGGFTGEECNVTNLTDGQIGFGSKFGASCGAETNFVNSLTYSSANGWNLTDIVVYTLWQDYGREGQYYDISYSTLSNPTTFLPLASVTYNPFVPGGIASGNRVSIAPVPGQSMLATNVAAIKFDFTGQGSSDYAWSGYTELVLLGSELTSSTPTAPVINPSVYSNGNLILTGTGGTANGAYMWLTTTNVALPLTEWTTNSTGALDGAGAFSNAIPVGASQPARFFKLKMQ